MDDSNEVLMKAIDLLVNFMRSGDCYRCIIFDEEYRCQDSGKPCAEIIKEYVLKEARSRVEECQNEKPEPMHIEEFEALLASFEGEDVNVNDQPA